MTRNKRNFSMAARAAAFFLLCVCVLVIILMLNTWRKQSKQLAVTPIASIAIDEEAAAGRLSEAVRAVTVSVDSKKHENSAEFFKLHALIAEAFPQFHKQLRREVVNKYSLLYTWPGSDKSAAPILLMAHQDVVPVGSDAEKKWQVSPFSGTIKNGYVWGRGAWDNKSNLMALMEAAEKLIQEGYRPKRTIYFAFGHDEEIGGNEGAKKISELLQSRGVKLKYVLDEGLLVTEGIIEGLDRPVALIGVAEKGNATLTLNVQTHPGHSSMPPTETAIGMMSEALTHLESNQRPAELQGAVREMFDTVAPEMSGLKRIVMSNLWLFKPVVEHEMKKAASTNAMLRTTTAFTVFSAGDKENVLPATASAKVNFRLAPGESVNSIVTHVKESIANDEIQVTVNRYTAFNPAVPSRADTPAFKSLNLSIRQVFGDVVVAPGLMVGGSDSRYFVNIADNTFRFSPVRAKPGDLSRFHGTDERISVSNYAEMIRFYRQLIVNSEKIN